MNKANMVILLSVTIILTAIASSAVTSFMFDEEKSTTSEEPVYLIDHEIRKTGIILGHNYGLDNSYISRHAYLGSDIESRWPGSEIKDPDERINALRDYEYIKASIGYNVPDKYHVSWNEFQDDIAHIRETSNSPYYRDALEAYADARGNATKAIQVINEAHPVLLSAENFETEQIFSIAIEMPQDDNNSLDSIWELTTENIPYTIKGGVVTDMKKDYEGNALLVSVDAEYDGYLLVTFPIGLINSPPAGFSHFAYFVIVDNEEVDFEEVDSGIIKIYFQPGTSEIEVIGVYS